MVKANTRPCGAGCGQVTTHRTSLYCAACSRQRKQEGQRKSVESRMARKAAGLPPLYIDDSDADMPAWMVEQIIDAGDRKTWRFN